MCVTFNLQARENSGSHEIHKVVPVTVNRLLIYNY